MKTSSNNYLHSVDFLRGVSALGVMVYHFLHHTDAHGDLLSDGNLLKTAASVLPSVVFIFFSLSGFVIAMSMHRNQFQLKSIGGFLARRWVRIEIPYIASILVYIGISLIWAVKSGDAFFIDPLRILHHITYTVPFTDYAWYNQIYWTLGLEFQFYILIALLFPLFRSENWMVRYGALLAFSLSGLILTDNRIILHYAPMFVLGIVAYFHWFSNMKKHPFAWVLMVGCVLQVGFVFDSAAAVYIALSMVIIQLPISKTNAITRVGRMGYSLYLIHGAAGGSLLYFLTSDGNASWYSYAILTLAILFSIGASYLFYRWVEFPSIKSAKRVTFGNKKQKNE